MCGRYALTSNDDILGEIFRFTGTLGLMPRYNIAPTQLAPVIRATDDPNTNRCSMLTWGLVPSWSKDPSIGSRMINARSETADSKPSFRSAFKRKRCIVPASAFYEWKKIGSAKQPFAIRPTDAPVFAFAGLWESWNKGDAPEPLETFTILTTNANSRLADLHLRMPVILGTEHWKSWLDPDFDDADALKTLMQSWPDDRLELYPVSRDVNRVSNDRPDLLEPIEIVELPDAPEVEDEGTLFG